MDQPRESDKQLPNTGETTYHLINLMYSVVVLQSKQCYTSVTSTDKIISNQTCHQKEGLLYRAVC